MFRAAPTPVGVPQYVQTRRELEEAQMKKYEWEQDQIKRACLARFLVRTAARRTTRRTICATVWPRAHTCWAA